MFLLALVSNPIAWVTLPRLTPNGTLNGLGSATPSINFGASETSLGGQARFRQDSSLNAQVQTSPVDYFTVSLLFSVLWCTSFSLEDPASLPIQRALDVIQARGLSRDVHVTVTRRKEVCTTLRLLETPRRESRVLVNLTYLSHTA